METSEMFPTPTIGMIGLVEDAFLFGEGHGRVVISVSPEKQGAIEAVLSTSGVPFATIGEVTDGEIFVDGEAFGNIAERRERYVNVLDTYLEN